jgi:hypothetical protein
MPADVAKSGGVQCLLMDLDIEKIVLDIERAILQVERPGDRRPFAERVMKRNVGRYRPQL